MTMFEKPLHANHHCRHYSYERGLQGGPRCAAGIVLDGSVAHCMPNPANPHACLLRQEFTEEECTIWRKYADDSAIRMLTVLAEIPGTSRDKKNKPAWGKSGEFDCPACNTGKVRWRRSSYNGHVAAACTTPNCTEFME